MQQPHPNSFNSNKTEQRIPKAPGWALTLADMMTLLLCFFALMFTVAAVDTEKYEAMSAIMSEAMGGKERQTPQVVTPEGHKAPKNLFELQLELSRLVGREKGLELKLKPRAVAINLPGALLFNLGKADLTPKAKAILDHISGPLMQTEYGLTIEGHTDDIPIHSGRFPSNWELSSARASAVARHFIGHGFDRAKVKVVGLADTKPVAPNLDKKGRPIPANQAKNRRVTILVHPVN